MLLFSYFERKASKTSGWLEMMTSGGLLNPASWNFSIALRRFGIELQVLIVMNRIDVWPAMSSPSIKIRLMSSMLYKWTVRLSLYRSFCDFEAHEKASMLLKES